MKRIFLGIFLSTFLLSVFSLAFFPSCNKEKPTSAIITVVDSAVGTPVVGANVRLHQDSLKNIVPPDPDRQITDIKGQVQFTLNHAGIWKAQVTKPQSVDTAQAVIRFEEGTTVQITIKY